MQNLPQLYFIISETSNKTPTALLRKIKYDDIKSPQNQSKITVSTDSSISFGLSTPQTKSINTSTNWNFKETASKTKVNDYIRSSKKNTTSYNQRI